MSGRRVAAAAVDAALRMEVPGAQPLLVQAREVTYVSSGGVVGEAQLSCELTPEDYERVDRAALFHLDPDARGPGAGRFAPARAVRLTLRLAAAELAGLLAVAPDPPAAARVLVALSQGGRATTLLSTQSWLALSVTSPVQLPGDVPAEAAGELWSGYATTWGSRLSGV